MIEFDEETNSPDLSEKVSSDGNVNAIQMVVIVLINYYFLE